MKQSTVAPSSTLTLLPHNLQKGHLTYIASCLENTDIEPFGQLSKESTEAEILKAISNTLTLLFSLPGEEDIEQRVKQDLINFVTFFKDPGNFRNLIRQHDVEKDKLQDSNIPYVTLKGKEYINITNGDVRAHLINLLTKKLEETNFSLEQLNCNPGDLHALLNAMPDHQETVQNPKVVVEFTAEVSVPAYLEERLELTPDAYYSLPNIIRMRLQSLDYQRQFVTVATESLNIVGAFASEDFNTPAHIDYLDALILNHSHYLRFTSDYSIPKSFFIGNIPHDAALAVLRNAENFYKYFDKFGEKLNFLFDDSDQSNEMLCLIAQFPENFLKLGNNIDSPTSMSLGTFFDLSLEQQRFVLTYYEELIYLRAFNKGNLAETSFEKNLLPAVEMVKQDPQSLKNLINYGFIKREQILDASQHAFITERKSHYNILLHHIANDAEITYHIFEALMKDDHWNTQIVTHLEDIVKRLQKGGETLNHILSFSDNPEVKLINTHALPSTPGKVVRRTLDFTPTPDKQPKRVRKVYDAPKEAPLNQPFIERLNAPSPTALTTNETCGFVKNLQRERDSHHDHTPSPKRSRLTFLRNTNPGSSPRH